MYGIRIRNNNRQILISDSTYNLVFVGKASLAEWHTEYWNHGIIGVAHQYGYPYQYLGQAIFFFTAPNDAPIVPMFYCPEFCGIMSMVRVAGNQWRIDCYSKTPPEIYIFQKVSHTTDTGGGRGIAVKNVVSGGIAYCSNFRHMFPKAVESVYTGPSNIQLIKIGSSYAFQYSNQQEYATAVDLSGVSKPIIGFHSGNNAAGWTDYSLLPYQYYFGIGAKVQGNSIITKWCMYWQGNGKITSNAPDTVNACVVADARHFD